MGANPKIKGNKGETEAIKVLNGIVNEVRVEDGLSTLDELNQVFYKNRDQVLNGGHDVLNDLGLAVEVKRKEVLLINNWWTQTVKSAERHKQTPVLMFRQNNRKWRVMLLTSISDCIPGHVIGPFRAEINYEDFRIWLRVYYRNWLKSR